MKLRDYQLAANHSCFESWKTSRTTLGVMATGCGKTVIFASIIRRMFPGRTMVIAHRQELIWQARDKIKRVTGLNVDVEMGEYKARTDSNLFHPRSSVIVSTVQTHVAGGDGGGRIGKFDPNDFRLLIIDEAHHATSKSYRRVIDYYMTNPKLLVLGLTATPDRSDEEALGQVFETVSFDYEMSEAIKDGWLVPVEQQAVSIESLDLSKVRTTAGDLNGADLSAVMESEKNLHGLASSTIDIIGSRRGIGFASSVNHANVLSNIFNRHRQGMSACVSAKTDKEERKKIIADFACGKIQWLWNCGVFTEGFDDSGVEVIAMGRPTESRALYAQMAGRATRPAEEIASRLNETPAPILRRKMIERSSKPAALIIDFVGNSGKHKLVNMADILGGNMSDEAVQSASDFVRRTGKAVRMQELLENEEERLEKIKQQRLQEEARKAKLTFKATYKTTSVDPFDLFAIKPIKARGWDEGKILSEKQRGILRKAGYNPDDMDYARGKQLVSILVDRWVNKKCTLKQASLLKRYGWSAQEVDSMSFDVASASIDSLSKNGWSKPAAQPKAEVVAAGPVYDNSVYDEDVPF